MPKKKPQKVGFKVELSEKDKQFIINTIRDNLFPDAKEEPIRGGAEKPTATEQVASEMPNPGYYKSPQPGYYWSPRPDLWRYKNEATNVAGYKRVAHKDVAWHLIPPIALRRQCHIYAEGLIAYGPRNWESGSLSKSWEDILNHVFDHLNKWLLGDRSEDHLAKAVWGLNSLMHFEWREGR